MHPGVPNEAKVSNMANATERLKAELAQLPLRERADVAHFLIRSLDEEEDEDAEAAWEAELARRLEEIENGTAAGIPADKVFADLREKYK
jgi:putative addiction module component (TIGR02574 family)